MEFNQENSISDFYNQPIGPSFLLWIETCCCLCPSSQTTIRIPNLKGQYLTSVDFLKLYFHPQHCLLNCNSKNWTSLDPAHRIKVRVDGSLSTHILFARNDPQSLLIVLGSFLQLTVNCLVNLTFLLPNKNNILLFTRNWFVSKAILQEEHEYMLNTLYLSNNQ